MRNCLLTKAFPQTTEYQKLKEDRDSRSSFLFTGDCEKEVEAKEARKIAEKEYFKEFAQLRVDK